MAKFTIAQDPTFTKKVKIPRIGRDPVEVGFTFKYRTQSEVADLLSKWGKRREEASEKIGESEFLETIRAHLDLEGSELLEIVESWEFDDELCHASAVALCESVQGLFARIKSDYFDALKAERLGN
ncbi:phage tail assembly chaperone [Metapseudomonas otitidis]|uniref:phage tail assembly chaperone n=1 Tax=Metapseudomonas otitidis TaxID=319939 RepID=UPI00244AA8DB|nr:phage tail assembly chaperone [Pseudomonas otitidis]MDH0335199.1 phage tail assembly chaperone [Pseudomonas otitidis]